MALSQINFHIHKIVTSDGKPDEFGGVIYTTTIDLTIEYISNTATFSSFSCDVSAVFCFTVDNRGVIIIDNKTNPQALLGIQKISMVLAAEMYIKATEQVEGSLYGRTIYGIYREIRWHYYAYLACKLNVVRYADIGGMNEDRNDYDYNAKMFENPLRIKEVVQEWIFSNIINKMAVVSFLDPVIYNMQN